MLRLPAVLMLPVLLIGLLVVSPLYGVINPKLQPSHLAGRYLNVLSCRVTAVDTNALTAALEVQGVSKGKFAPKKITMKLADKGLAEAILSLRKGQAIVAYAGKKRQRREKDILYYIGGGLWYTATMTGAPGKWTILANADKGKDPSSSEIMFGTFNGNVESLWEMMRDTARRAAYYPAVPLTRFSAKTIASLDKPIVGVAVYDVNADGRCDLFACSAGGNRLFIQDARGAFIDRTEAFGLKATSGASCSFADVDADGDADMLLDGVLYRQAKGRFTRSKDVPAEGKPLSAAFVEYNGDGYPDVVVSRKDEGLSLYVNPGNTGGAFADKTETAGLTDGSNGEGMTGYFEACDWDFDGRTDLIYVAGPGYLLWQNAEGVFESSEISGKENGFDGGTAAFGTIVRPGLSSVYLVAGDRKSLICEDGGNLSDVTRGGNEIQDPAAGLQMALAEDLNADGTVDLYAASGIKGISSFYVANRGYGSFMLPEKYSAGKVIPPGVYNQAARGLAAGDVNGDGAPDVLVGGLNGKLSLLVNETLTDRPAKADVSITSDLRMQIQTRIVTVKPAGAKGLAGCRLTLIDARGKPVTHRWIGTNIGVGCCGPAQLTLAVRQLGSYTLQLRMGDGSVRKQALVINEKTPRHQVLTVR
ncbi:MAG: VCBS repeat-containing protein [Phycisphaerae bacterium]|nr:VCBS repeat-containing protein [Phycisphaerae bacterium]